VQLLWKLSISARLANEITFVGVPGGGQRGVFLSDDNWQSRYNDMKRILQRTSTRTVLNDSQTGVLS